MNPTPNSPQVAASGPGSFWSQLQPASYRGVAFGVKSGQARFGRRNALHEYPYRDTPWVEDMGRQSRRIQLTGFLVGDDVIAQRAALIAACEKPGEGELVHPTLGRLTVALMEVSTGEHWEEGRVFEVSFTFLEQGQRLFPGAAVANVDAIAKASKGLSASASAQWSSDMRGLIASNTAISIQVSGVTRSWISSGLSAVNSATGLMNLATSAVGNFGRLLGQASGLVIGSEQAAVAPLEALFGAAAELRTVVSGVAYQLQSLGAVLSAGTLDVFAGLAASYAAAVQGACFTPADAIRSMSAMTVLGGSPVGAGASSADYFRRLAVCQLAIASSKYQPSTADEAAAIRAQVLLLLDAEMLAAGNQGNDTCYASLRALRAEVILDLNAKGAQLPTLVTVTTPAAVPSLVLAQRLYRDETREAELVRRANPVHPAFMPLSFRALKS